MESLVWARKSRRESPTNPSTHRCFVVAHAAMGAIDDAKAALVKLREARPGISLRYVEHAQPFADPHARAHYIAAFRLAGLE